MRTKSIINGVTVLVCAMTACVMAGSGEKRASEDRRISIEEYRDKMAAGWIGQMAGVAWGAPTEMRFKESIIPIDEKTGYPEYMGKWDPKFVNRAFGQDDLRCDLTFLQTLHKRGFDCTIKEAGIDFASTAYSLSGANSRGRTNMRFGIAPPDCSHPEFSNAGDFIDYQIEADYSGLIAPGMPQIPVELGEKFGRLVCFGDGLYAGQFVGAMYSEAFFETNMRKVIEKALTAIPSESGYAQMVRDMLKWSAEEPNWQKTYEKVIDKHLGRGLDAKMNGAFILMGLLYGENDPEKTLIISTRCGMDSDCNPSNAAGILFTALGMKNIPDIYYKGMDQAKNFRTFTYNFDAVCDISIDLAKKAILREGGSLQEGATPAESFMVIPKKTLVPSAYLTMENPGPIANSKFTQAEMKQIKLESDWFSKGFAVFAPGWQMVDCIDVDGAGGSKSFKKQRVYRGITGVYIAFPKDDNTPVIMSRRAQIPAGKSSTLKLTVGASDENKWNLQVRINNKEVLNVDIMGEKKPEKMMREFNVNLSDYAGQEVDIALHSATPQGGEWTKSYSIWKKPEIVSE